MHGANQFRSQSIRTAPASVGLRAGLGPACAVGHRPPGYYPGLRRRISGLTREGVSRLSLQAPTDKALQRRVGLSLFNLKTNLPQPPNKVRRRRLQFVSYGHLNISKVSLRHVEVTS